MARRRSRREYAGEREYRYSPAYLRRGEVHFQDSSDDLDTFIQPFAAPALAPIRRFTDFESDPAPYRSPRAESTSWVEYPPYRPTPSQEPRRPPGRPSPPRYSLASLLRPFFRDPQRTAACVRRKERREVIFAKTGGGRGMPPRRRTAESNFGC